MAVDMFLKLKGITGESKDKKHPNEIDVLAWSWGASNAGAAHVGGGAGAGKVHVQDISLTKYVDSSSAALMKHCCTGTHIDLANLVVRKAGGTAPLEYMKYEFKEVYITSVSTGGSGGEDKLTENISLNFRQFKFEYQVQDDKGGGKPAGDIGWDISANATA